MTDVLIAGGGVAGSTMAILLGRAGLRVELFERGAFPREKPCGEGVMPAGVASLVKLGREAVGGVPLNGVRYHCRGRDATGSFPSAGGVPANGLAQRRAVLDRVLFEAAAATPGVTARTRATVESPIVERGRVTGLVVQGTEHRAPLTVAADGVHSPLRRALGLDRPARRPRFGMRAHYRLAPGTEVAPWVDIFLGKGHELYVTHLPQGELLVAALVSAHGLGASAQSSFDGWVSAQQLLVDRLRGAERITPIRGVSPLATRARRGFAPGLVLLGDAAGSLDPITGGGMTQALESAELLARYVPRMIEEGDAWLAEFERRRRALLSDYVLMTRGLLWLERHPRWIGPALAAGNSIVLKPSELTPLTCCAWPTGGHPAAVGPGTAPTLGRPNVRPIRFAIVALIAALAAPAFARAADGHQAVPTLLAAGDSAMARLDLSDATQAYTQAHHEDPKSYEAAWKLARAYADSATMSSSAAAQERLCRQAETAARAAVALRPDGAKGHAFLAVALGKLALFAGGKQKVRLSPDRGRGRHGAGARPKRGSGASRARRMESRSRRGCRASRFFASTLYGKVPQGSLGSGPRSPAQAASLRRTSFRTASSWGSRRPATTIPKPRRSSSRL
jgi:flavin-dependent dehydrogenase